MKKFLIVLIIFCSCDNKYSNRIERKHVEKLAENFMKNTVIPKMNDPKPYEIVDTKMVTKTVADNINDYRFVYDHLSFNHDDSILNKMRLDSIMKISHDPGSIVSITVNVAYKTRYKLGDIVTDSIKLGYDPQNDKITLWPF